MPPITPNMEQYHNIYQNHILATDTLVNHKDCTMHNPMMLKMRKALIWMMYSLKSIRFCLLLWLKKVAPSLKIMRFLLHGFKKMVLLSLMDFQFTLIPKWCITVEGDKQSQSFPLCNIQLGIDSNTTFAK